MSVFISYSHLDESFVDKLCLELIRFNIPVWRDKHQMQLGDSIIDKIQNAMERASFTCYVISRNSVNSGWVKKEINIALHREIEDVSCTILPLVIDDCQIPLFIRDKLYADFREDFDAGVKMIVNAVAEKYNLFAGRLTNKGKTTSYATDVITYADNHIEINIDIISQDDDCEYYLLTKLKIIGNDKALEQYQLYLKAGEAVQFVSEVFGAFGQLPEIKNKRTVVGGAKLARVVAEFENAENGLVFRAETITKKVGYDDGKYILFNLGLIFQLHSET